MKERNYSVDFVKGILIICVVLGHILLGVSRQTFVRYMIYSVQMPLFMGMSGYLLNFDKLEHMKFPDLVKKYVLRVGISWFIAVNVYFVLTNGVISGTGIIINKTIIKQYIKSFITPYYHLWYVQKFLIFVLLTWVLIRILCTYFSDRKNVYIMLVMIAALISGVGIMPKFHTKQVYYYIFFIFGMTARELVKEIRPQKYSSMVKAVAVISVLAIMGRIWLFFTTLDISAQTSLYYFVQDIPLLILVVVCCEKEICPRCRFIEFLGKESLAVYLWHVLGKLWVVAVFGEGNSLRYYFANVIVFAMEIGLLYLGKKVKFIDRYLFGNVAYNGGKK